jgi:hypothetical protein
MQVTNKTIKLDINNKKLKKLKKIVKKMKMYQTGASTLKY